MSEAFCEVNGGEYDEEYVSNVTVARSRLDRAGPGCAICRRPILAGQVFHVCTWGYAADMLASPEDLCPPLETLPEPGLHGRRWGAWYVNPDGRISWQGEPSGDPDSVAPDGVCGQFEEHAICSRILLEAAWLVCGERSYSWETSSLDDATDAVLAAEAGGYLARGRTAEDVRGFWGLFDVWLRDVYGMPADAPACALAALEAIQDGVHEMSIMGRTVRRGGAGG